MATSSKAKGAAQGHGALLRVLQNVARLPSRTAHSVRRLLTPDYRLERTANRAVQGWLSTDRRRELESIEGMSSHRECRLLAHLATQTPPGGVIVEIGAWLGKSTAWLVEGAQRLSPPLGVVSIDPHQRDSWTGFCATVERFRLQARGLQVHRAFSHDIGRTWSTPIGMLWVDGCHEYEPVLHDIDDFTPHVIPGGWVVFDDAAGGKFPGVERAIAERLSGRGDIRHVATVRNLQVFRRPSL